MNRKVIYYRFLKTFPHKMYNLVGLIRRGLFMVARVLAPLGILGFLGVAADFEVF